LSGKLPQCLGNKSSTATVLNLRNNSFSGDIPETFTSGCSLRVIDFCQNKLEGKIPKSLANCTKLEILNLEQNNINDVFPSWLGVLPHPIGSMVKNYFARRRYKGQDLKTHLHRS
jgi:hypothetical protein